MLKYQKNLVSIRNDTFVKSINRIESIDSIESIDTSIDTCSIQRYNSGKKFR